MFFAYKLKLFFLLPILKKNVSISGFGFIT
jgi:hypothetical protein